VLQSGSPQHARMNATIKVSELASIMVDQDGAVIVVRESAVTVNMEVPPVLITGKSQELAHANLVRKFAVADNHSYSRHAHKLSDKKSLVSILNNQEPKFVHSLKNNLLQRKK